MHILKKIALLLLSATPALLIGCSPDKKTSTNEHVNIYDAPPPVEVDAVSQASEELVAEILDAITAASLERMRNEGHGELVDSMLAEHEAKKNASNKKNTSTNTDELALDKQNK